MHSAQILPVTIHRTLQSDRREAMLMNQVFKPALVIGSGFHRHVLGDVVNQHRLQPLWDWNAQIDGTAGHMQVACPSREQEPVIRWETLIIRAQKDGYRGPKGDWIPPSEQAANEVEEKAKVFVANILKQSSTTYPEPRRSKIILSRDWDCVSSVNFDHV